MSVEVKAQNDTALASVKAIYDAADQANTLLGQMQAAATAASTTLTAIYTDAENAKTWANGALSGLSTLESLIDTVQWIADHKKASTDVTVDPDKTYYTYDSATGTLSKVDPEGTENPSQEGWYELDEAVTNYIASRLVEANEGLYVADIGNGWKVLISSGAVQGYAAGVHIIDPNGYAVLAATAAGVSLNASYKQRIGGTNNYIEFDPSTGRLNIIGSGVYFGVTPIGDMAKTSEVEAVSDALQEAVEGAVYYQYTTNGVTYEVWYDSEAEKYYYFNASGVKTEVSYANLDKENGVPITTRAHGLEDSIASVQDSVSTLNGTVSSQAGDISQLQYESITNAQNISAQAGDITTLQNNQQTIQGNVSNLVTTVGQQDNRITDLEKAVVIDSAEPSVTVQSQGGAVKITDAQVTIKGKDNTVSWADSESFNATKFSGKEFRAKNPNLSSGSKYLALVGRSNGHMSIVTVT